MARALQLPTGSEALVTGTFDSAGIPAFKLFRKQPFKRLARPPRGAHAHSTRTLSLVLLAWVPLALLSGWEGRLNGVPRSFTDDVAVHARLLIELPVLLYCRRFVDELCGIAIEYFPVAGMVDARHRDAYRARLERIASQRDSWLSLIVVIGLSYFASWFEFKVSAGFDWWRGPPHQLSLAGTWYYFVARPLVVSQILAWFWSLILWARLLRSLLALPLRLSAYHPDMAAGLSPLLRAHIPFAALAFALSTDVAGGLANALLHTAVPVLHYRTAALLFVAGLTLALLSPLVLAIPALFRARQAALLERGELACIMSRKMDEQSNRAIAEDAPASYFPLFDSYWSLTESTILVTRTRPLPITKPYVLLFLGAAALPILLAALTRIPAKQAFGQILSLLTF
jgi:hypothetical protein